MSKIRGLFIGDAGADTERQKRAFRAIGGEIAAVGLSALRNSSLRHHADLKLSLLRGQF